MTRWWLSQRRVQYSALPLVERQGVEDPPHRPTFCKRNAAPTILYIALFSLVAISVSLAQYAVRTLEKGWSKPKNNQLRAFEVHRESGDFNATALLSAYTEVFQIAPAAPRASCLQTIWHNARYASLNASSHRPQSILLAFNLINAQSILPNLLVQLPGLLEFLGPHNVHVSVYENGSGDLTQDLLLARK